jgi:hypothetical protein
MHPDKQPKFVIRLYAQDGDGNPVNFDPETAREIMIETALAGMEHSGIGFIDAKNVLDKVRF